jgi:hypothetical protein
VQLCGDAHLSNFGAYASPERTLLFDLNDFDETCPGRSSCANVYLARAAGQTKRPRMDSSSFGDPAVSLPDQSGVHDAMATPIRSVPAPIDVAEVAAFEGFFDAERTRLFGALAVMSGNRAEAEEVMQDAFLTAWERWDRVSAMESPEGFLYRTAICLVLSLRSRSQPAHKAHADLAPSTRAHSAGR